MILPGSYANGFSPRDGQPLYPELWRGCVGAWAPCLGPTGLTLRDWSGLNRHGDLTSMPASSAWVSDGGRTALFFDGTNDYVTASNRMTFASGDSLTASIWFRATGSGTTREIFNRFNGTTATDEDGWLLRRISTNKLRFTVAQNGSYSFWDTAATYTDTAWHNVVVTHRWGSGSSFAMYVDGIAAPGSWTLGTGNQIPDSSGDNYAIILGAQRYGGVTYDVWQGYLNDARLYTRYLIAQEAKLLGSKIGIAYDLSPRRRSSAAVQFNRRRRLLIGAGS